MQEQPGPDACRVTIADTGQSFLLRPWHGDPRCRPDRRHRPAAQLPRRRLRHLQERGARRQRRPWLGAELRHHRRGEGGRQVPDLPEQAHQRHARDPARRRGGAGRGGPARADRGERRSWSRARRSRPRSGAWCVALPKGVRFRYRAGMHVEIATPGRRAGRGPTRSRMRRATTGCRPTVCCSSSSPAIAGGHASNWLHDGLGVGQPLAIHGPYGSFRWPKDAKGPVLCLAGGSGLAPILAVLQEALGKGYADPVSAGPVGARPERAFCARCLPCAGPAPREFLLPGDVEPGGGGRSRHGLASRPDLRLAAGRVSRSLGLARAGRRPARLRRRMRRERAGPGCRRGAHPGGQLHADRGVRVARP